MSFPSEVPEKWMCTHVRAAGWGRWWSSLDEIRGTFLKRETDFARFQNETQYTCFPYLFVEYEKFYLFIHVFCTINIEFFFFFCTNICTNIFLQFFFFFRLSNSYWKEVSFVDDPDIYTRATQRREQLQNSNILNRKNYSHLSSQIVNDNEIYLRNYPQYGLYIIISNNSKSHL